MTATRDGTERSPAAPPLDISRSLRLWERATAVIPGGSQTNSKRPRHYAFGRYPIYLTQATGCRVWDVDGNEYIDYVNGMGPISLGHRYPAVDEAVRAQLGKGVISGLLWPLEIEAAEALVEVIPGAEMVRFLKGGGEATAAAARIARAATGRHVILNAGYRGWPDTWSARADPAVPPVLGEYVLDFPHRDLNRLAELLEQHRGRVAAVCMDVPYNAVLPGDHLAEVQALARAHGALFVLDEVVAGFRLAQGGAHEYFGVTPDLACFAKAMANGLPLAAVVGRKEIMAAAERSMITVTYGGEALSLAACLAVLRVYRERPVIATLWTIGRRLMAGMDAAARQAGVPFACDGYAPMFAMRFDLPSDQLAAAWELFLSECAARGVLMRRGGLTFMTYSHTESDVEETITAAAGAFAVLRDAGYTQAAGDGGNGSDPAGRGQQVGIDVRRVQDGQRQGA